MQKSYRNAAIAFGALVIAAPAVHAQEAAEAHPLAMMFGEWRGTANGVNPDQSRYTLTQTERVGPMLGGDLIVIEGRGYDEAGSLEFNAFGVISHDERRDAWEFRGYNDGSAGTFALSVLEDGFEWVVPAGPEAKVVYTATIDGETWTEIGVFHGPGMEPVETFSMTLTRIGDTDWPAGDPVGME